MIRLWIDDIRPAPEGYVWKKSVDETIEFIAHCLDKYLVGLEENSSVDDYIVEILSLDHDAGDYAKDGGDYIEILNFMELYSHCFQKMNTAFHIHSMNPVGRQNMQRIIEKNGWKLIR